jgi:cell division septation protein DedD
VVQVSSLTEEPRARKLERELIEKGFPAFIEKAEVGGKIYHRVRVGPRSERTDINAMASSLSEKTGYKGQILRYP